MEAASQLESQATLTVEEPTLALASDTASLSTCFVIPVHNEERTLVKCLTQAFRQNLDIFDVCTVLDRCTDRSEEISEEFSVNAIIKKTPTSWVNPWAEVLKYGIDRTKSDIIVWLDADFIIPNGAVGRLVKQLKGKVAMASCRFRSVEYGPLDKCVNIWNNPLLSRGGFKVILREAYEKIGGMVDTYACDTILDLKLIQAGYEIYVDPELTALHDRPMTFRKWLNQWIRRGRGGHEIGYPLWYNIGRGIYCLSMIRKSPWFLLLGPLAIIGLIIGICQADERSRFKEKIVDEHIRKRISKGFGR
jgi:cellulose synthase/poly-beta-1,6-N-acetylglucosamine synthase-like glycosyltransferase